MKRIICGKTYDTESSQIVKKVTSGIFGDPKGYEETLYITESGFYFFYTNGGADSPYKVEKIKRMSKQTATKWLSEQK